MSKFTKILSLFLTCISTLSLVNLAQASPCSTTYDYLGSSPVVKLKNSATYRYRTDTVIQSAPGQTSYPGGFTLWASDTTVYYPNSNIFQFGTSFAQASQQIYPNGSVLRSTAGEYYHESQPSFKLLDNAGVVKYLNGNVARNASGTIFDLAGTPIAGPVRIVKSLGSFGRMSFLVASSGVSKSLYIGGFLQDRQDVASLSANSSASGQINSLNLILRQGFPSLSSWNVNLGIFPSTSNCDFNNDFVGGYPYEVKGVTSSATSSTVTLSISAELASTKPAYYIVSYLPGGGPPLTCENGISITPASGTTTLYTVSGLTAGTSYGFRVCAADAVKGETIGRTLVTTTQGVTGSFTNLSGATAVDPDLTDYGAAMTALRVDAGTIYQKNWDPLNGWGSTWYALLSGAAKVSTSTRPGGAGWIDVFNTATSGNIIWTAYNPSTGWSAPLNLGGAFAGQVTVVAANASTLYIGAVTTSGQVQLNNYSSGAWSGWYTLGGGTGFTGNLGMTLFGNTLQIVGRKSSDGSIWVNGYDFGAGSWTSFYSIGGTAMSSPFAYSFGATILFITARDTSGAIYARNYDATASSWGTGWYSLGIESRAGDESTYSGQPILEPIVVSRQPSSGFDIIARGAGGAAMIKSYNNVTSWSNWYNLGNPGTQAFSRISVVPRSANQLAVLMRGSGNTTLYGDMTINY